MICLKQLRKVYGLNSFKGQKMHYLVKPICGASFALFASFATNFAYSQTLLLDDPNSNSTDITSNDVSSKNLNSAIKFPNKEKSEISSVDLIGLSANVVGENADLYNLNEALDKRRFSPTASRISTAAGVVNVGTAALQHDWPKAAGEAFGLFAQGTIMVTGLAYAPRTKGASIPFAYKISKDIKWLVTESGNSVARQMAPKRKVSSTVTNAPNYITPQPLELEQHPRPEYDPTRPTNELGSNISDVAEKRVPRFDNRTPRGLSDPPNRTVYPKPLMNEFGERVEGSGDTPVPRFTNQAPQGFDDPPRRTVYPEPPTNEFGERVESPDDTQVSRFADQTPQGLIDPSRQSAYPMPPLGEAENQHSQAPNPRSQTVLQQSGERSQDSGAPETIVGSNSENYLPPNQGASNCTDMYGRTVNYSGGGIRPCLKKLEKTEDGYVMHLQLTPGETRPFNIFEGSSPEMVCEAILAGPDRDNCMQYVQRIKPDVGYKDETNNFGAENSGSVDEASNLDAEKSDPDSDTSGKNQSPLRRDFPQCDPELTNQAVSRSGGVEECIREQKILEKQIGEGLDHYPECGPAPELPMISTFNAPNQNGGGDWRTSQALNKEPTTSSNSTSSLLANKLSNFKRRRTAIKECLQRAVRVCEEQKRKNEELRSACGIPAPYAPISWNDMSSIQRSNERAQEFERCYGFSKFEAECGKHPGEVRTHDINVLRRAYERQQSIMSCAREIMLREQQENEEDQCPKIPTDEEALRGFDTGNYVATADLAQQSSGSETQLGAETEKSSLNLPAEASQQDWIDPKVADKLFDTLLPQ